MTTLKDIAKKANVSVMTVSRVVNGNHEKVSKKTTVRVQKIIDELGYVPNYSARSLSSKKTNIIAIILRKDSLPDDPYNAMMLTKIIPYLQDYGYFSMVVGLDHFDDVSKHLKSWHAAGAIFLGMFEDDVKSIQESHQIPLIFTDSYHTENISNVGIDNYKGGYLAGHYLAKMNHKNLAFASYGIHKSPISQARLAGYKAALKEANISLDSHLIYNDHSALHIAEKLIQSQASGIFVTSDRLALDLVNILKEKGYHVPQDYSIIGFDNLPYGLYSSPKLTTISQNIVQKAEIACDLLLKHIDHKLAHENIILDVNLEIRESVTSHA